MDIYGAYAIDPLHKRTDAESSQHQHARVGAHQIGIAGDTPAVRFMEGTYIFGLSSAVLRHQASLICD